MVHVGAARLIPEDLEPRLGPLVEPLGQALTAPFLQPRRHLSELAQAARPDRRQDRARVFDQHARPVHEVPLDDVLQHTG